MESEISYLESVLNPILSVPEDMKVTKTTDERGVLLSLHVNRSDMGRVIGLQGKTASALRTLMRVFGAMNDKKISLKIEEPE